ncbi:MAG: sulfate permease [Ardenticatenaceae bacterium]|nr:sulfate permease [Ardenticatenaceae bacterium]
MKSFVPILSWLPAYQGKLLRGDVIAALTVWALLVPEAMAYAGIAGLPPETGLYTAPLALIAYAIFGTSRHLSVGPSSTVAALSFTVVAGLAVIGSGEFLLLSVTLALVTGLLLIAASFLRLGVMADFLSRPVLDGFVVGVAISIAVGQLDKILGYEPKSTYSFVPEVLLFIRDITLIHWPTFLVGTVSLGLLFALHKFVPKIPAALVVLFLSIILSSLMDFAAMGIHIVGQIPASLPPFGLPEGLSLQDMLSVMVGAGGVALVAFAESVAIARSIATRFGYEVRADQELLAVGAANLGAGFCGGFVVDGSMSKTAASVESGAQSQMVSIIAAVAILITAVALTPLFYSLPEATLGAIVIHAVWHSINLRKVGQYRGITTLDYATAVVALGGVLLLGLLQGLLLATFLALVVLLFGTKRRNTAVLGKVPGTTVFRSIENYPDGETFPGLVILRFDGALFFANAPDFISAARQALTTAQSPPKVVLIDGESMNGIDATAAIMLMEFQEELTRTGIELRLCRMKTEIMKIIQRTELYATIPPEHYYLTVEEAVKAYLTDTQQSSNGRVKEPASTKI